MPTVLRQKEVTTTHQLNDGSIEEERKPVYVYIHCYNQGCIKYHNLQSNLDYEQKVPGLREETIFTYKDRGGDAPGTENSHVRWLPQDSDHLKCDECGWPMNVSGTPSYKLAQYGVGPGTGLKGAERAAALAAAKVVEDNAVAAAASDAKIKNLEAQLSRMEKMFEKLTNQPQKPPVKP